jgi:hypothetical protein
LSDGLTHVTTLAAHVVDSLAQSKGLSSKNGRLQNEGEKSETPDSDGPPVYRRLAEAFLMFSVGFGLIYCGAEIIAIDDKRRRSAFFLRGSIVQGIGVVLMLSNLFAFTWAWPI